jgi:metal-responsive CopG/Arc/MetJ family transcriptional regulator
MFNQRKVKITKDLYERLAAAAERAGYSSTDEFIQHVLEQSVSGQEELSDQEQAERQLRGLGYLE